MSLRQILRLARKLALSTTLITSIAAAQSSPAHRAPAQNSAAKSTQPKYKGIFEPVNYPQDIKLKDVFFSGAENGWVVGEHATILHTSDGGSKWVAEVGGDPSNQQPQIRQVRALDAQHAWALEDNPERLLGTADGHTWNEVGDSPRGVADFSFTSAQHGIVLANGSKEYYRGGVFLSEDGGKTWKAQIECKMSTTVQGLAHNDECWFLRLQVFSPRSLYALAVDNSNSLALFHSEDAGLTWTYHVLPFPGSREDDFFVADAKHAVVVFHGDGKTHATDDDGQNWHVLLATSLASQIHFADPEVGWTLGPTRNYGRAATISYTTDGGQRWASADVNFPPQTPDEYRFSFPRRDRAYVIGPHGMIYRYRIVPAELKVPNALSGPMMPARPEEAQH